MSFSLDQLAALTGGTVQGDGALLLSGAATLRTARPGEITLVDNPKLAGELALSRATAVVVPHGFEPTGRPYLSVPDVHTAFRQIVLAFRPQRPRRMVGVHPLAYISPSAKLAEGVEIHPHAVIGDDCRIGPGTVIHAGVKLLEGVTIGAGCVLFPNVVCYENTVIGDRVVIHAGAVLGAYGFGYTTQPDGTHMRRSQLGNVEIGDDVEIGAGAMVDRGAYGPTRIGAGSKLDNLVQIGHNCQIGPRNLICSQVGFAGSASTGENVVFAGQAGIRDHVHVGDRAVIGAKGGVMSDLAADGRYVGIPCTDEREQFRAIAVFQRLPEMRKQVGELAKAVARLEAEAAQRTEWPTPQQETPVREAPQRLSQAAA